MLEVSLTSNNLSSASHKEPTGFNLSSLVNIVKYVSRPEVALPNEIDEISRSIVDNAIFRRIFEGEYCKLLGGVKQYLDRQAKK